MSLDFISIPPTNGNSPKQVLVALHGWGSNAQDLAPLTPLLTLPDCQFIFPHAPFAHPQIAEGKAWYSLETSEYQGLSESRELLYQWLQVLPDTIGVPLNKTFLCGFSQGGAMTLDVGLKLPLAGLCCLSGYLHSSPQISSVSVPPVLIVHGRQDAIVPIGAAQKARDTLTALKVAVEYQEFDMRHEIQPIVLKLVENFILAKLLS